MPTYMSQCNDCGLLYGEFRKMKDYDKRPRCAVCGESTAAVILSAPASFVKGKFDPFISPVDGSLISTQKGLKEHNKRNKVSNIHDGYTEKDLLDKINKPRESVKIDKKDVAADVVAAMREVENGYKPTRAGAQDE